MRLLGIDPGLSGGWTQLDEEGHITAFGRMPKIPYGKRKMVDARQLYIETADCDHAVVEAVHAMPGQGVSSMFSFGSAFGVAYAVATIRSRTPVVLVPPQTWKRYYGLRADKREALDMAEVLWPGVLSWGVLANDGIAEAALMAKWMLDTQPKLP